MVKAINNVDCEVTIAYSTERIDALNMQLKEDGGDVDGELIKTLDQLYSKKVTPTVKKYIQYRESISRIAKENKA